MAFMVIGMNIKELRLELGLTQEKMSLLFDPPIPLNTIKKWDSGISYPPAWVESLVLEKMRQSVK